MPRKKIVNVINQDELLVQYEHTFRLNFACADVQQMA